MTTDERHWILDPAGHREAMLIDAPKVGDTLHGIEIVAVLDSTLAPEEWYCDLCNGVILTRWGEEPMPAAITHLGGNAICGDCRDAIEEEEGPWPPNGCQCAACAVRFLIWYEELANAYGWARAHHPPG